ncbi:hypothetical protein Tco_0247733 [Tanacetum coccineum]
MATFDYIYRDNIQEYVSQAAAANFNQRNTSYRPQMVANQIRPPGFPLVQNHQGNNQSTFNQGNNYNQNRGNNFIQSQVYRPQVNQPPAYQAPVPQTHGSGTLPGNTITNPKEDLKGITTRSGVAYQGPAIPSTSSSSPKVMNRDTEIICPESGKKLQLFEAKAVKSSIDEPSESQAKPSTWKLSDIQGPVDQELSKINAVDPFAPRIDVEIRRQKGAELRADHLQTLRKPHEMSSENRITETLSTRGSWIGYCDDNLPMFADFATLPCGNFISRNVVPTEKRFQLIDFPDCEDSRARSFAFRVSHSQLHFGNPIS